MMLNRIFCAEQIVVSPELPGILKDLTKAAIRAQPADLNAWCAEWFGQQLQERTQAKGAGMEMAELRRLFDQYDADGNGVMDAQELGSFVRKDLGFEITEDELQAVVGLLDTNNSGKLEFEEVYAWWSGRA